MAKFEKYSVKSLANQMFCLPLSLPKSCYHSEDTYFCRNTANYLSGVIFFDGETLASFREGFASFCTYLTKLSDQCQSLLKVELRRKASRLPYRPRNGRTSTSSPRANSSNFLSGNIKNPITPEELYRAAVSIVAKWCNDVVSGSYASMYNVQTQLDALQNIYRKN